MENATSSSSLPLAAPFAFLFCNTVFLWAAMLRKSSSFSLRSFWSTLTASFASRPPHRHVESTAKMGSPSSPPAPPATADVDGAGAGQLQMVREDVEKIMEIMGLPMDPRTGDDDEGRVDFAGLADTFVEREPTLTEVEAAFAVFDADGDGFIGPEDLRRVLCDLGFGVASELRACESMIAAHDENGDGRIDFGEFVNFFERSSFCC